MTEPAAITIRQMNKWYGQFHVLRDINLDVARGERIVVCGPSGSGKSTLIRCINRLEEHQQGDIIVDGIPLNNNLKNIDEVRREVGMVFQHFNLFPHLTVLENCTLAPIWVRKLPKAEAEDSGASPEISRPVVRWPATARGDCAQPVHEPQDHVI
jgi:general L-amino acid transport system ATP-binding protein